MRQAMVTIAAKIAIDRIDAASALIEGMGNPARPEIARRLDALPSAVGVHFASLHALRPVDLPRPVGTIVLEFSADGEDEKAIRELAKALEAELKPVFAMAEDWADGDLSDFLVGHKVKSGFGWTMLAGLPFAGTPVMSVSRIRQEAALADRVRHMVLHQKESGLRALERLEAIRSDVRKDAALAWALEEPPPLPANAPYPTIPKAIPALAKSFVVTYLWFLLPLLVAMLIYGALTGAMTAWDTLSSSLSLPHKLWALLQDAWTGLSWLLWALLSFATPLLLVAGVLYCRLRKLEAADWVSDLAPDRKTAREILARENHSPQNHMVSITVLKPGLTRKVTIRLAFWIVGTLCRLQFRPGHLAEIDTIHFARWVQLPGTRDIVFFSNYDGSWESYLEDFITRAHEGLTAVWSNTVGFPRSANLFQEGATDGERFKRYARRSMVPTAFWYSAYPALTTSNIRSNAVLRRGLAAAMTEQDAQLFLAQFGSAERPESKLETTEIQSLVFGGLGFKPFGLMMAVKFGGPDATQTERASAWLRGILDDVAFGDGRRLKNPAVATLALGPDALPRLGLAPEACTTFPAAFLEGMADPARRRLLGDVADDWRWSAQNTDDAVLLVYGDSATSVSALRRKLAKLTKAHGHRISVTIPLQPIPEDRRERKEPFGFVDGTSQPIIRGTYRSLRSSDPLHLVEAGEIILGYPDNRGNVPPGPVMAATADPDNRLPTIGGASSGFAETTVDAWRDIGRNGSFLVIRQLEQNTKAFWGYCDAEAARLAKRMQGPFVVDGTFIAAKMIGRWPDGSSLVRNPYTPYSDPNSRQKPMQRLASNPQAGTQIQTAGTMANRMPTETVSRVDKTEQQRRALYAEDNDFLYGSEDPEGFRCPFGAHIRRANPRESIDPGSQEQINITNRHRILRVGRSYRNKDEQGLLFMCLNADIERQFEFVQQTWMRSQTFHGLSAERDPLSWHASDAPSGYTIPSRDGPVGLSPMQQFVTVRGGGYFFVPGRAFLRFLTE